MTCDKWYMIFDTWNVPRYTKWEVNIFTKWQVISSNGLCFMVFWRFGGKGRLNKWINDWQMCSYNCPGYTGSVNYIALFWHPSMSPQQIKKTNISKALILYFLTKKRPAQEGRTDRRICRDRLPRCTYWSKWSTLHLLFIALASLLPPAKVLVLNGFSSFLVQPLHMWPN